MVIIPNDRQNCFNTISQSHIIFKFLTMHSSLNNCSVMSYLRCNDLCNMLKDFGMTFILIRTSRTQLSVERYLTLFTWCHICAALWFMSGRTSNYFVSFFIEFFLLISITSFEIQVYSNSIRLSFRMFDSIIMESIRRT